VGNVPAIGRTERQRQEIRIGEAGADALELNVYYLPTDLGLTGPEVEQIYLDILEDVKKAVTIPVAMKLSPYFSAMANLAHRLSQPAPMVWYCSIAFTNQTWTWRNWT
jgi:dihydroorotate dehydrogenase